MFKGIIIILIIILLAAIFNFNTILWLASKIIGIGIIAIVIIFQPELRRALESLGRRSFFSTLFNSSSKDSEDTFTDHTMEEILEAVEELSSEKTGALICIEKDVSLSEYEGTGLPIDAVVTRQLLVNIFEDKTPLHDGAVVIRNNRVTAATCYLPMSASNDLGKQYGTRHRAGKGISEVSDAFTIIVSEETGGISFTYMGEFHSQISVAELKNKMIEIQGKSVEYVTLRQRIKEWLKNLTKEDEDNESSDEKDSKSA